MLKNIIIATIVLSCFISIIESCGCYGEGSCDVNGNLISGQCREGECDCCPACNSCNQLLSGCLANRMQSDVNFYPAIPSTLYLGQSYSFFINTSSQPSHALINVCISPSLPEGLSITQTSSFDWIISGTPTETLPATTYRVIIIGSAGYLGKTSFSFNIRSCVGSCTLGYQRCSGTGFQTCIQSASGVPQWGGNQPCGTGTSCSIYQSNYIICS